MGKQFVSWKTFGDVYAKMSGVKHDAEENLDRFVRLIEKKVGYFSSEVNQTAETTWFSREEHYIAHSRPYYNVSNEIVEDIAETDLDIIKANMLDVPAGLGCVNIRFEADSCVTYQTSEGKTERIYSILIAKFTNALGFMAQIDNSTPSRLIGRYIMLNEKPLSQSFGSDFHAKANHAEGMELVVKIIATLKFLTDCPDENLIEFDVVNKHYHEYKTTQDQQRKDEIIATSKRKGHNGWNVGTNQLYLNDFYLPVQHQKSQGTGRELEFAHIRKGHLHIVRFGQGKQQMKIQYFRPVVVRSDLPFKQV